MMFHDNCLLADDSHEISYLVMIGALRVNKAKKTYVWKMILHLWLILPLLWSAEIFPVPASPWGDQPETHKLPPDRGRRQLVTRDYPQTHAANHKNIFKIMWCEAINYYTINYTVNPVFSCHSKRRQKLFFMSDYRLMEVKIIAECSKKAFCNTFDLH